MVTNRTRSELHEMRARFQSLLKASAPESEFQSLFARAPEILSNGLPLRLVPTDIRPLGRPGKSEPDFIFHSRSSSNILNSFGVVELKRPDTKIVTKPRKRTIVLARDAATAVAQAQIYRRNLQAELIKSAHPANFIVGSRGYAFIIAGLTSELSNRLMGLGQSIDAMADLLPMGIQLIPYDELLARFESALPPSVLYFTPLVHAPEAADPELVHNLAEEALASRRFRLEINDENFRYWTVLEDLWRGGGFLGTSAPRVLERSFWCVSGTDSLATESPAHLQFPAHIQCLVDRIALSSLFHQEVGKHGQAHAIGRLFLRLPEI